MKVETKKRCTDFFSWLLQLFSSVTLNLMIFTCLEDTVVPMGREPGEQEFRFPYFLFLTATDFL